MELSSPATRGAGVWECGVHPPVPVVVLEVESGSNSEGGEDPEGTEEIDKIGDQAVHWVELAG
jgi:hypothetical protein